jgi:hypothetical protein
MVENLLSLLVKTTVHAQWNLLGSVDFYSIRMAAQLPFQYTGVQEYPKRQLWAEKVTSWIWHFFSVDKAQKVIFSTRKVAFSAEKSPFLLKRYLSSVHPFCEDAFCGPIKQYCPFIKKLY